MRISCMYFSSLTGVGLGPKCHGLVAQTHSIKRYFAISADLMSWI
jgi:hypothetical protein